MGEIGRENGAKLASKLNKLKILCLISAKAQNYYFSNTFNGFLRFRGSMLGGKIDLGVSWRPLGASWSRLKASWRLLGAS